MELNEFINKSIRAIIDGVVEAQSYAKEKGAKINPSNVNFKDAKTWTNDGIYGQNVEFDVAVVANESQGGNFKAGINVAGSGLGGQKSKGSENSTNNRIKFYVPLFLPPQT